MDGAFNVSYVTLGGFVEVARFRYLYFLTMLTVYVLIISCNSVIVYLICVNRSLHEPMYVFIAALLVNSVVFSSTVYPKLLSDFLSERQIISYPACLFQFHMNYSLAGSEFLLLSAMSYDRYVSICKPLLYQSLMRRSRVVSLLVLCWVVPACQNSVPVLLSLDMKLCDSTLNAIFCNNAIYGLHCETSRALYVFGAVALINFALVPILFILFTYARIFIITFRKSREVRRKAAQTCLPHLIVLFSFSCLCAYDVLNVRLGADFPQAVRQAVTLLAVMYHPLFNPLIYGLKMKEISKHLKKMFRQRKMIRLH